MPRLLTLGALTALGLTGCYRGSAADAAPSVIARDPHWIRVDVPEIRQTGANDCGAAALASVLAFWGKRTSLDTVEHAVDTTHGGASAGELERVARANGLSAYVFYGELADIEHELSAGRPVIVGLVKPYSPGRGIAHYEVVTGYEPLQQRILTFDPARGLRENAVSGFLAEWQPTKRVAMVTFDGE